MKKDYTSFDSWMFIKELQIHSNVPADLKGQVRELAKELLGKEYISSKDFNFLRKSYENYISKKYKEVNMSFCGNVNVLDSPVLPFVSNRV